MFLVERTPRSLVEPGVLSPMSAPAEVRVDATHPVLSQIVDAANKGFTGTLEGAAD